jgi:hypothetical protein
MEIAHPQGSAHRQFAQRLALYRNHTPYRQVSSSP